MTANVRIVTDTRDNVLKVPNAALRYRPAGVAAAKDGDAPAPAAGAAAAAAAAAATRRRGGSGWSTELKLDAAQQARLDEIFAELRARMAELREVPEADRRSRGERAARRRAPEDQRDAEPGPAEEVRRDRGRRNRARQRGSSGRVLCSTRGKPQGGRAAARPHRRQRHRGRRRRADRGRGGDRRQRDAGHAGDAPRPGAPRSPF